MSELSKHDFLQQFPNYEDYDEGTEEDHDADDDSQERLERLKSSVDKLTRQKKPAGS